MKPKVCVNLEFRKFMSGIFFKNTGNGILSSYNNQKKILQQARVEFTEETGDKDYNILQLNVMGPKAFYLIKRAKRKKIRIVGYTHMTPEDFKNAFLFSKLLTPLLKKYLVYMYNRCDFVICPSEYTKKLVASYGVKTPSQAISNGVDIKKFCQNLSKRTKGRKDNNLNKLTIFSVGLVFPRKSPSTLVEAAKKFSAYDFIWFGKIYSKILVKKLPDIPENMRFTGYVPDIISAFCAGDIFLFPSHEENEGMAVMEAAAMRKPIIVRDIPVYESWLFDGVNCLKAKNQEEFERCIESLAESKKLREKLGKAAYEMAQKNSTEIIGRRLQEIYLNLLAS